MDRELRTQEHFKRVFTVTVEDERHLRSVTANHIRRRDECVARVFAYMCLLKALPAAEKLGDRPHFRCERAAVQDRRSLGRFSMQAAHCLPGQIYIGGSLPWDLFPAERGGAAGDLRRCFEAVDNLPVNFNWADSQAESGATESMKKTVVTSHVHGRHQIVLREQTVEELVLQEELTEVFRDPCEQLYSDDILLLDAYLTWISRSEQVYADGVALKVDRMFQEHDGGNADAFERRQLDAAILAAYRLESGPRRTRADESVRRISQEVSDRWGK